MMMAQPEDVYQLSGMTGYPEVGPTGLVLVGLKLP
jgi:hypothetical protein